MVDMICFEVALAFVIVATLAPVATTSASQTVRGIASKTVNSSAAAVLISVVLAVWFFCWPPTSAVGSPPQLHAQDSSGTEGTRPADSFQRGGHHEIDLRLSRLTR
jgi:hypothetical protein